MPTTWLNEDTIWPQCRDDVSAGAPIALNVSSCDNCGQTSFPAVSRCTWCGGEGSEQPTSVSARIVSATSVLHPTPGAELEVPYVVALVRFQDAGVDILGRVVGSTDPAHCAAGTKVTVVADSPCSDGTMHYAYHVESGE